MGHLERARTRTLRYDWFLSSDGTECEVREAYTGPEGLIEHNSHILEARTKLFKEYDVREGLAQVLWRAHRPCSRCRSPSSSH